MKRGRTHQRVGLVVDAAYTVVALVHHKPGLHGCRAEVALIRTIEAVIDEHGEVRLLENVDLPNARRALVTILEEEPAVRASDVALLSETALAEDWNRPEEDDAWSHLQHDR